MPCTGPPFLAQPGDNWPPRLLRHLRVYLGTSLPFGYCRELCTPRSGLGAPCHRPLATFVTCAALGLVLVIHVRLSGPWHMEDASLVKTISVLRTSDVAPSVSCAS